MKNVKIKKSLLFFAAFGMFILFLSGFTAYYSSPAYSDGYYGVGVATPNFVFSFGNGVNVYEAPIYGGYIYRYNGYYYRWLNGGWVYTNVYAGPWYPVTPGIYLPEILTFGPPPPVVAYPGYFSWWRNYVGPWYRYHHPGWWGRHHMYLRNYNVWHEHEGNFYRNHPYQNWRMRRPFGVGGPAFRPAPGGPAFRPAPGGPAFRPAPGGPAFRPAYRGQAQVGHGPRPARRRPEHEGHARNRHKRKND